MKPLDRQRQTIAKLTAEIATTRDAPWPQAERDRLLRAQLQATLDRSVGTRERFAKVIDPVNRDAAWPDLTWPTLIDAMGIDALHASIMQRIDTLGLPDGLLPAERAERIKRLEADRFRAEAEEESLVCRIEAECHAHVLRRVDADPLAILTAWEKAA
ncbi:MAG: hypothetical protein GEV05_28635 [Betaproteobacteria bacterium]|nr:hypothetical protein [Betaproteobacteria bacterium]